jgi:hypothetical protein
MENLTKCYCGHTTTCDCGPETLEEVAEKYVDINVAKYAPKLMYKEHFIAGAKWQQERSYSEEEVIWALLSCPHKEFKNSLEVKEWWNNFKSK